MLGCAQLGEFFFKGGQLRVGGCRGPRFAVQPFDFPFQLACLVGFFQIGCDLAGWFVRRQRGSQLPGAKFGCDRLYFPAKQIPGVAMHFAVQALAQLAAAVDAGRAGQQDDSAQRQRQQPASVKQGPDRPCHRFFDAAERLNSGLHLDHR